MREQGKKMAVALCWVWSATNHILRLDMRNRKAIPCQFIQDIDKLHGFVLLLLIRHPLQWRRPGRLIPTCHWVHPGGE